MTCPHVIKELTDPTAVFSPVTCYSRNRKTFHDAQVHPYEALSLIKQWQKENIQERHRVTRHRYVLREMPLQPSLQRSSDNIVRVIRFFNAGVYS